MGDREPLGAMDAYRWLASLGRTPRFNEFPWGPGGPSILELRDGSNECKHGRCPFDKTPPCGCFFPLEHAREDDMTEKRDWLVGLLREHVERTGIVPQQREWAQVAPYGASVNAMRRVFGKWSRALRAAGYEPRPFRPRPAAERFWAFVDQTEFCWNWTGGVCTKTGYGGFYGNGTRTTAHRFAYELLVGPVPEGHHIDHLCRNTVCVNPEHLEPVLPQENIRRAKSAKVTWKIARQVRASSETNVVVAQRFGISESVVSRIRSDKAWHSAQDPRVETGELVTLPERKPRLKRKRKAA